MIRKLRQLAVLVALVGVTGCTDNPAPDRKAYAEKVIAAVDRYQADNGRLPESLSVLGFDEREDSPAYYEKLSGTEYRIWYGLSLGRSMVFDSSTKTWQQRN